MPVYKIDVNIWGNGSLRYPANLTEIDDPDLEWIDVEPSDFVGDKLAEKLDFLLEQPNLRENQDWIDSIVVLEFMRDDREFSESPKLTTSLRQKIKLKLNGFDG